MFSHKPNRGRLITFQSLGWWKKVPCNMHRPPPRKGNQGQHQSHLTKKQHCRSFHGPFQSLPCPLHRSCLRASLSIPAIKGANLVEVKCWTIWILTPFPFQTKRRKKKECFCPSSCFRFLLLVAIMSLRLEADWIIKKELWLQFHSLSTIYN